MAFETILYERTGNVVVATLNRPDQLNAFNTAMFDDMMRLLDRVDRDDDVRALVVTGAGRGFCAGADLSGGAATFDISANTARSQPRTTEDGRVDYSDEATRDRGGRLVLRLYECLKLTIAAVNGPAVGVGATMTLPMDVRLAAPEARYGFVFARRGIVAESCSSWFLPRIVGIPQALRWMMSGAVFSAEEAKAGGLVSEIIEGQSVADAATRLAADMVENTSAVSAALVRQLVWRCAAMDHPMEAHKAESRLLYDVGRGKDAREGVAAFLEKRKAQFPGKVSSDMPPSFPWWEERPYS